MPLWNPLGVRGNTRYAATQSQGGGGALDLNAFMFEQAAGLSFDATKADRFFIENTGVNLADDVGELIGLALDDRLWSGSTLAQILTAATERITDGGFANPASWSDASTGTGTSIVSGGVGTIVGTNGSNRGALSQAGVATIGLWYRTVCTVAITSGAASLMGQNTGNGGVTAVAGANSFIYRALVTAFLSYTQSGGGNITLDDLSVKEIPTIPCVQATLGLKPSRQTSGAKFDGLDDFWLTTYLASATDNFIVARVTVPSTLAATQRFVGTGGASDGRLRLGFNTSGFTCAALGADQEATILGSTDRRNTEVIVGLSFDGTTVRLFDDDALAYEAAQNGAPTTTVPLMVGAYNANGTSAGFFGGSVKRLLVGREFLDLTKYRQIRSALLAA